MKRSIIILLLLISASHTLLAQVVFKTITKQGPVIVGESFQVQYVLEDVDNTDEFFPPDFKDFRFVNGPYIYKGDAYGTDGTKHLKNIIYTLQAIKPGRFVIPAATALVNGLSVKSDKVIIEVIGKTDAIKRGLSKNPSSSSSFFLQPGKDPYEAIRENLFIKVVVNKRICFVGEPVTATFKLYSRLESRSDIVKNPGFYGFTVQDMIGLDDKQVATELVNGKKFDVHTVRMVQLYPLQAGSFTIDPMEVENKVKLIRTSVNKNPEQEIIEGVFPGNEGNNTEEYETSMSTEAVKITVKPPAQKNKPIDFTGATGRFIINSSIEKNEFNSNEEGYLTITISGKGNFTQLSAPIIPWPNGLQGFEPKTKDHLDNKKIPLTGERTFSFPFVSSKPGNYLIPAIIFSFFDPDSNSYKTASSKAIQVTITNNNDKPEIADPKKEPAGNNYMFLFIATLILIAITAMSIFWFKKNKKAKSKAVEIENKPATLSVAEILKPLNLSPVMNDKGFYALLRSCIWNFFTIHFGLSGSQMSRQNLLVVMHQKNVDEKSREDILEILQQCDTGIFTDAVTNLDRAALFARTKTVLEKIDPGS